MNNKSKLVSFNSPTFLAYLLIAPAVIYLLCIVGWPLFETFRLSFTNASIAGEEYVGFQNYEKLLSSSKFSKIAVRTFVWTFFSVLLKLILGMIGAVLLNASLRGRTFFRILVLPPWVVPIAIGALGWMWVYNGHFGILSGIGIRLGILDGPFSFLAYKKSAFIATMVTDVWVGTPFVTLFFLAGMQAVPKDLYEAAYCDGAGRFRRFYHITLPQITPVIISMSLISAVSTFVSFDIIFIMTEGGPRGATTTLIIDTYKMALGNYKFGRGSARAVMIVLMITTFAILYFYLLSRINKKVSHG